MSCEPSAYSLMRRMLWPCEGDQYVRVQQEGSHLNFILKQALHLFGSHLGGSFWQNHRAKAIHHAGFKRRLDSAPHQLGSRLAQADRPRLGVGFEDFENVVINI